VDLAGALAALGSTQGRSGGGNSVGWPGGCEVVPLPRAPLLVLALVAPSAAQGEERGG